jgi:hypothetical protein
VSWAREIRKGYQASNDDGSHDKGIEKTSDSDCSNNECRYTSSSPPRTIDATVALGPTIDQYPTPITIFNLWI